MGEIANDRDNIYYQGKRDAYDELLGIVRGLVFQHEECASDDLFYGYVEALRDVYEISRLRYCNADALVRSLEKLKAKEENEEKVESITKNTYTDGRVTYTRRTQIIE